mmetsp:Transcript_18147/g.28420  ORF Transcript_18147/g.28420 Transcript_18147/m.28420 type:complete len:238 (-) Transcript_18147:36-749(-)
MFLTLFTIDPALGKVDKFSLSQEILMDLLTSDITNRDRICKNADDLEKITWVGVTPSLKDEIVMISWYQMFLDGPIHLEWLPVTLVLAKISVNRLHGTVNLTNLPETLEEFIISTNDLTGSLKLESLPESMKNLALDQNHFVGSVNLEHLPKRLEYLYLQSNDMDGRVNLTKLPPKMRFLNLSRNGFIGNTDFSQLPSSLEGFSVRDTKLSGEIFLKWNGKKKHFSVKGSGVSVYYE